MPGKPIKVWPVKHLLGVSLVRAGSSGAAAKKAEKYFGAANGPYIPTRKNVAQHVIWARAMGAEELE